MDRHSYIVCGTFTGGYQQEEQEEQEEQAEEEEEQQQQQQEQQEQTMAKSPLDHHEMIIKKCTSILLLPGYWGLAEAWAHSKLPESEFWNQCFPFVRDGQ